MFINDYPYTDSHELNADFLLKSYRSLVDAVTQIDGWIDTHEKQYEELKAQIEALESGQWSDEFVQTLIDWYKDNIIDIIGEYVKQVFFALTDEGYFVAYIPESWDDIIFGTTGLDDFPIGVDYGHLTLTY